MSKLRIVESSDAADDIDPDMVKLAHDLLSGVASGEVAGFIVGFVNDDGVMDWGYSGQFCAYAMKTHLERRMGDLLDELEGYGEDC